MKIEDFNGVTFPVYFKSNCQWFKATGLNEPLIRTEIVTEHSHSIAQTAMTLDFMFTDNTHYCSQLEFCTREEFKEAFAKALTLLID
jgi:hypothetical protein